MNKKHLLIYAAGVLTAPAWAYICKKPLTKLLTPIFIDEDLDETLYTLMQMRLDLQDLKKRDERLKGQQT